MTKTIRYNVTACGTCEQWVGEREPSLNREFSQVDPDAKGKCFLKPAIKIKLAKDKVPACWQKWFLLKQNKNEQLIKELNNLIDNQRPQNED